MKKNGHHRGIQKYFCLECKSSFSSSRRPERLRKALFEEYFYHRTTLKELSQKYGRSRAWVQREIHAYEPERHEPSISRTTLIVDATFFGKRPDQFGLLVAKNAITGSVLSYRFTQRESKEEYRLLRGDIETKGIEIQAVVTDGKPGLFGLFGDVPQQMCHFHQQAILTRYLTRNPKQRASIDLKRIASCLGRVDEKRFRCLLHAWHNRHAAFLDEKVEDDSKRGWHYKHKRLRSAYRSLQSHLPYLFTYQKHPLLKIPNTTNALDGGVFSPLKNLLAVHRGIGVKLKKKLIVDFLEKLIQ